MLAFFASIAVAATSNQNISSPTVGAPLPQIVCMHAGGGERKPKSDRSSASVSRPTNLSVKTEAPPAAAVIFRKTLEMSTIDVRAPLRPSRTKPTDGVRAAAPRHLHLLVSAGAVDPLGNPPRHPARPTEVRSTRISNTAESGRFSVSIDFADWRRRACASFDCADSSLLEVLVQGEPERADQAL